MTAGGWQPERVRLRLGLAVLLLVAAQLLAIAHYVGHAAEGDSAGCDICIVTGQAGGALLPSVIAHAPLPGTAGVAIATPDLTVPSASPSVYRSRAPPPVQLQPT